MDLHTWWLFFLAVFLLSGTPGPNMIHVMVRSIQYGMRKSSLAMLGCLCGIMVILLGSAAGLGALLLASPAFFAIFRYCGVAYLIYLGIRSWRGTDAPFEVEEKKRDPAPLSGRRIFLGAFIIGVSNPKMLLFSAAFLPQFIDIARPQAPQYLVLALTFAMVEGLWYGIYGFGGRKLAGCLAKTWVKRMCNRITGGIFIGFGLTLLAVER